MTGGAHPPPRISADQSPQAFFSSRKSYLRDDIYTQPLAVFSDIENVKVELLADKGADCAEPDSKTKNRIDEACSIMTRLGRRSTLGLHPHRLTVTLAIWFPSAILIPSQALNKLLQCCARARNPNVSYSILAFYMTAYFFQPTQQSPRSYAVVCR